MHTGILTKVIGALLVPLTALAVAAGIAHHPSIPGRQVQRVAAELGPEMPAFKQLDIRVHDLSLSIISAAEAQDRERISADFQQLINGCLACHTSYKERVANALKDLES